MAPEFTILDLVFTVGETRKKSRLQNMHVDRIGFI